jgi:putative hemolysin
MLVERLSDGAWSIASTPAMSGVTSSVLTGVSCPAAAFCVAVGTVQFAAPHRSPGLLAETWNGASWSGRILPTPAGGSEPSLAAVSCPAAGACVAVGYYYKGTSSTYRPLAERLSGSTWSVLRMPVPPHGGGATSASQFTGVDCPAISLCEVAGDAFYNDTLQNVFGYGLNGSAWTYQRQVNPGPDPGNSDDAVSCSGTDACTSVGSVQIIGELALAERWDGSAWARQATSAPAHRPETALNDVSCAGDSSCVSVGGVLPRRSEEGAPHRPTGHGRGLERDDLVSVAPCDPQRRDRRARRDLVPLARRVYRRRRRVHGVERINADRGVRRRRALPPLTRELGLVRQVLDDEGYETHGEAALWIAVPSCWLSCSRS